MLRYVLALSLALASPALADDASDLIAHGRCHCGCGRSLPGADEEPCFGCSVGKAEVTFILESLAEGHDPRSVLLALSQTVLVEVFADYTHPTLAETWRRARQAADALQQHRVVLRTPAFDEEAWRGAALAECARERGRFTLLQTALIDHESPWDVATLLGLAERVGLDRDEMQHCLAEIDIDQQLAKDRAHVNARKARRLPAVFVNQEAVANDRAAITEAIRRAMLAGSI